MCVYILKRIYIKACYSIHISTRHYPQSTFIKILFSLLLSLFDSFPFEMSICLVVLITNISRRYIKLQLTVFPLSYIQYIAPDILRNKQLYLNSKEPDTIVQDINSKLYDIL